jgi:hypothetical protein
VVRRIGGRPVSSRPHWRGSGKDRRARSAHPLQFPRLDPWCGEIAEPRAGEERRSKCCAALLYVHDDADRSPANLGRSVRLIKSNFGPEEEVHDPTIPCRASSRQCAVSAAAQRKAPPLSGGASHMRLPGTPLESRCPTQMLPRASGLVYGRALQASDRLGEPKRKFLAKPFALARTLVVAAEEGLMTAAPATRV